MLTTKSKKTSPDSRINNSLNKKSSSASKRPISGTPVFLQRRLPSVQIKTKLIDPASNNSVSSNNISQPEDSSEKSANHLAERILSMPDSTKDPGTLQKSDQPASVHNVLGSGETLPDHTRDYFESRFNQDLSHIRIHNDQNAHHAAGNINARAFTQNNHIAFDRNQFNPDSNDGRQLLAHELAHATECSDNRIYRESWHVDDRNRKVERQLLVQLIFENTLWDAWNGTGWTTTRKNQFRTDFENSIESAFNSGSYVLKPPASANDVLPQQNVDRGYKPLVDIQLVPDGDFSISEDWEVDVSSNPTSEFRTSSSSTRYGTLDEADNAAVEKRGSAPDVTQVPTVHEFGHFIGLDHPGEDLEGNFFTPSRLSPGSNEYTHTGTDAQGRTVDGPNDLMGSGMGMRPFYYDAWAEKLDDHISDLRLARELEQFQERLRDLFRDDEEKGDFPVLGGDTRFG